ncbi:hypothetical protein DFH28DRAFT_881967 [Melampsora americana]|nr:hypothetical protein DFH28DRAFT_881967 [Melampsora americana]
MVKNGLAVRSQQENSESSIMERFGLEIPFSVGLCDNPCKDCGALHWRLEWPKKTKSAQKVSFQTCCQRGAVKLPSDHVENDLTPPFLQRLLSNQDRESKTFRKNIRRYNNVLSFASTGTKQNTSVAGKGGSWTYKITGRLMHRIGLLLSNPGVPRKFAQIFMFGDQGDNESAARSAFVGGKLDIALLSQFQRFMYAHNPFAKMYKSAESLLQENSVRTIKIKSLAIGNRDKNRYNFPTYDQVAAVIDGDSEIGSFDRDIILQRLSGKLRWISELNTNYFSLRYPIFFMFGSHSWDKHYCNMHSCRTYYDLYILSLPEVFTYPYMFQ